MYPTFPAFSFSPNAPSFTPPHIPWPPYLAAAPFPPAGHFPSYYQTQRYWPGSYPCVSPLPPLLNPALYSMRPMNPLARAYAPAHFIFNETETTTEKDLDAASLGTTSLDAASLGAASLSISSVSTSLPSTPEFTSEAPLGLDTRSYTLEDTSSGSESESISSPPWPNHTYSVLSPPASLASCSSHLTSPLSTNPLTPSFYPSPEALARYRDIFYFRSHLHTMPPLPLGQVTIPQTRFEIGSFPPMGYFNSPPPFSEEEHSAADAWPIGLTRSISPTSLPVSLVEWQRDREEADSLLSECFRKPDFSALNVAEVMEGLPNPLIHEHIFSGLNHLLSRGLFDNSPIKAYRYNRLAYLFQGLSNYINAPLHFMASTPRSDLEKQEQKKLHLLTFRYPKLPIHDYINNFLLEFHINFKALLEASDDSFSEADVLEIMKIALKRDLPPCLSKQYLSPSEEISDYYYKVYDQIEHFMDHLIAINRDEENPKNGPVADKSHTDLFKPDLWKISKFDSIFLVKPC